MAEAEKPFTCDVSGCGIKFVCEDKLTSHKRRHNMMLTLNFANTGAGPRNCIEQTPTPTRFMDIIEETGLFQDLQPEFTTPEPAHTANPFDASFRKASSGEIVTKEPSHIPSTSEPLNTPCIMPVTADPLALRPQFTPASAVPKFGPAPLPTPKVEEASSDNTSAPSSASIASEGGSSPDEVTVVAAAAPDAKKLLSAPIIDKPVTLQVNPTAEAQSAVTGPTPADSVLAVTSPAVQVLPGVSPNHVAPVIAPVVAPPVTPIVPTVGSLPGSKATTIITPSNVIQIGESVQLLIVANPAPAVGATTQLPAAPLLQQNIETKLKDTLVVKGLSSLTDKQQATKCSLSAPRTTKPLIAPSDPNLGDSKNNCLDMVVDDERKKKNRENNRYAAQRSRAKKKRQSEAMRKELDDYKKLCADLSARNMELMSQRSMSREMELQYKEEIFKLKKQLALHSSCSVTLELQKKEKDNQRNQGKARTEIVAQVPAAITFPSTLALPTQLSLLVATKDPLTRTVLK